MPDINLKLQIDKNDLKKKLDVKDGHSPTPRELTELIKPLIPKPIKGSSGDKGLRGISGRDGEDAYTPIKNIDYFDGKNGTDGRDGKNGRDGIDKEPETGASIIKKIDPLKNVLNFQVLRNVPDFVLFKDLPSRGGDQGGGGGSIVTYRDSTAARISAYITDLQFGSGLTTSYSAGKITLTSTGLGGTVTSVASADGSITVTNPTTTPDLSVVQAPKLTTARTISITGDIAYTSASFDGSGNVTGAGTLASIIVAGGPIGSATVTPIITYDAKGRLTTVSSATITPAASSITGGATLTKIDDTNVTLTLGGSPSTALLAATSLNLGWTGTLADSRLSTTAVSANSYGSATQVATFTVSATGRLTAAGNTTVTPAVGSITGLGTGVATWLATPSSANLLSALTDKTGTGVNVFGTAPTFTTSITLSTANIITDTTTGTKFGTATNQKLAFYNSTPIVQPTGDVITGLQNLGLMASATITATTNANLTGPITSVGNATSIASQTGTGTKFVVDTSPTLVTPNIGAATATTISMGTATAGGNVIFDAKGNQNSLYKMRLTNLDSAGVSAFTSFGLENSQSVFAFFLMGGGNTGYSGANTVFFDMASNFDMAFGTNDTVRMTIKNAGNVGIGTATAPSLLTIAGLINMKNYTVATLPAGTRGDICYCTDLLAPAFFAVVVGGGTVVGPVFFNGAAWVAF